MCYCVNVDLIWKKFVDYDWKVLNCFYEEEEII